MKIMTLISQLTDMVDSGKVSKDLEILVNGKEELHYVTIENGNQLNIIVSGCQSETTSTGSEYLSVISLEVEEESIEEKEDEDTEEKEVEEENAEEEKEVVEDTEKKKKK